MTSVSSGYGAPVLGTVDSGACTGSGTTKGGPPYGTPWDADGMLEQGPDKAH